LRLSALRTEQAIERVKRGRLAHLYHSLYGDMAWPITCYRNSRMYQHIGVLDGGVIVRGIYPLAGRIGMVDAYAAQH